MNDRIVGMYNVDRKYAIVSFREAAFHIRVL